MNSLDAAKLFIKYGELKNEMNDIVKQINAYILENKESQSIAGVTATYYSQSSEFDYQRAVIDNGISQDVIDLHTKTTKTVSWKAVAEDNGINLDMYKTIKPARVVIK